jgi:adenylate kinase
VATFEETKNVRSLNDISSILPKQTKQSLNIVFLGAPGAGKGTQAEKLCGHFRLQHVATGDLFRENLNKQTELGQLAKQYMNRGELVPDDVTEAMVRERLARSDVRRGFVLDGFPRTLPQAEALSHIMESLNQYITAVLYFKVPQEELVARLSGRRICHKCQIPFHAKYNPFKRCPTNKCQGEHLYCRSDDKPDTVRARLEIFNRETAPLIKYYRRQGLLIEIDGNVDIADVTDNVITAVDQLVPVRNGLFG